MYSPRLTILLIFIACSSRLMAQEASELVDSVYVTRLDTTEFLRQDYRIGRRGKENLTFAFERSDTVLYTITNIKKGKVIAEVINPKGVYEFRDKLPVEGQKDVFAADTSGDYIFRFKNKGLTIKDVNLDIKTVRTIGEWQVTVNELGKKLPDRIDSIITEGIDTTQFLSHIFKLGTLGKEQVKFTFTQPDTVLYTFSKANDFNTSLEIVDPNGDYIFKNPIPAQGVTGSFVPDVSGAYLFTVKNKSIKPNDINFDLKTVKSWRKVEIKVKPPEPAEPPILFDTIPEILVEELVYLAAKKNIRSDYKKTISFEFDKEKGKAFGTFVIAHGKAYSDQINALVDIKTQESIGDPLVALGLRKIDELPSEQIDNLKFEFKGTGVNKRGSIDRYERFNFPEGKYKSEYKIALSNTDKVVGAYIYVKVVSFKQVRQTE